MGIGQRAAGCLDKYEIGVRIGADGDLRALLGAT